MSPCFSPRPYSEMGQSWIAAFSRVGCVSVCVTPDSFLTRVNARSAWFNVCDAVEFILHCRKSPYQVSPPWSWLLSCVGKKSSYLMLIRETPRFPDIHIYCLLRIMLRESILPSYRFHFLSPCRISQMFSSASMYVLDSVHGFLGVHFQVMKYSMWLYKNDLHQYIQVLSQCISLYMHARCRMPTGQEASIHNQSPF